MTRYRNVLVEIQDKDLEIKLPLRVFFEHDVSKLAGECSNIQNCESGLYVDIETEHDLSGLSPSIGYKVLKDFDRKDGKIYAIGVCKKENVDPRIPPIA